MQIGITCVTRVLKTVRQPASGWVSQSRARWCSRCSTCGPCTSPARCSTTARSRASRGRARTASPCCSSWTAMHRDGHSQPSTTCSRITCIASAFRATPLFGANRMTRAPMRPSSGSWAWLWARWGSQ
eukprot:1150712-Prymnesium_polylepis.1